MATDLRSSGPALVGHGCDSRGWGRADCRCGRPAAGRVGEQARYVRRFEDGGYIPVGFRELARDDLAAAGPETLRLRATNPTERNFAGQPQLAFSVEEGDPVLVPRLPKRRDYLVGRVLGSYRLVDPDTPSGHHQRPVEWLGTFQREVLSQEAVNTLGAILTILRPTRAEAELRSLITDLAPLDEHAGPNPMSGPDRSALVTTPSSSSVTAPLGNSLPPVQLDVRLDGRG